MKEPKHIQQFNLDPWRLSMAHDVCVAIKNSVATYEDRKDCIYVQKEH